MFSYALRRLALVVPLWLLVGTMSFLIMHLAPGDPVALMVGMEVASQDAIEAIRARFGVDKPLMGQLWDWLKGLCRADLGESFFLGRPVRQAILERFPVTLSVALGSLVIAVVLGVPLGVLASLRPNTIADATIMTLAVFGLAVPEFLMGFALMLVFAVGLRWFPVGGYVAFTHDLGQALYHIILPAFSLGFMQAALIARMTRSCMLEVLTSEYIMSARAKGLREATVVWRHAFRNAAIPVVTVTGLVFAVLLGGAFITEVVFQLPGMGSLVISAVKRRDYPVVQGTLVTIATVVLFVNLAVDLLYAYLDPRIIYD